MANARINSEHVSSKLVRHDASGRFGSNPVQAEKFLDGSLVVELSEVLQAVSEGDAGLLDPTCKVVQDRFDGLQDCKCRQARATTSVSRDEADGRAGQEIRRRRANAPFL